VGLPGRDVTKVNEMTWRGTQKAARSRLLELFDEGEVARYDAWVLQLTAQDDAACLEDIAQGFVFREGTTVLDAGAGTGALCKILTCVPGVDVTALEPSPVMLAKLKAKPELKHVKTIEGFCDAEADRSIFSAATFDVIISRQLVNGLFDPLMAFRNWHHWLKPGGSVIVIDGLYDRSAWTERWQEEVDVLPLSACRTTAAIPYLLETAGFNIDGVHYMKATNSLPTTRTPRYIVFASPALE
jgi:SAM-dependent methyltransferase